MILHTHLHPVLAAVLCGGSFGVVIVMAEQAPTDSRVIAASSQFRLSSDEKLERAQQLLDQWSESLHRANASIANMQANNQQIDRALEKLEQQRSERGSLENQDQTSIACSEPDPFGGNENPVMEYSEALDRLKQMEADLEDIRESNRVIRRNLESIEARGHLSAPITLSHLEGGVSVGENFQGRSRHEFIDRELSIKKDIVESERRLTELVCEMKSGLSFKIEDSQSQLSFKMELMNSLVKFWVMMSLFSATVIGALFFWLGLPDEVIDGLDDIDRYRLQLQLQLLEKEEEAGELEEDEELRLPLGGD